MKKSSVDCSASESWIRGCTLKASNVVSISKTLGRSGVDKDLMLLGVRPQPLKPTPRRRRPPLVDAPPLSSSRRPQDPSLRGHRSLLSCTPIYQQPQPQKNLKASQQELQDLRRLAILSMRAAIAKSHTTPASLSHSPQTLIPPPQPQIHQDLQELRRLAILSMRAAIARPSTSPLSPTQTQTHTTSLSPHHQTHIPTSQNYHSQPAADQQLIPDPEPKDELEPEPELEHEHEGDQDHGANITDIPFSPVPCEEDGDLISEDHVDHDSEASPIDDDDELMTTEDDADDFDARTKSFVSRITAMCSW